jgi:hypothetical protein
MQVNLKRARTHAAALWRKPCCFALELTDLQMDSEQTQQLLRMILGKSQHSRPDLLPFVRSSNDRHTYPFYALVLILTFSPKIAEF